MIIRTTNILAGPLVILVWAIDIYIFLACIRLILSRLPSTRNSQFCQGLKLFTDPLAEIVHRYLQKYRHESPPTWMSWTVLIIAGVIARHFLIWIIVSV